MGVAVWDEVIRGSETILDAATAEVRPNQPSAHKRRTRLPDLPEIIEKEVQESYKQKEGSLHQPPRLHGLKMQDDGADKSESTLPQR
jgi:hypothetical protein